MIIVTVVLLDATFTEWSAWRFACDSCLNGGSDDEVPDICEKYCKQGAVFQVKTRVCQIDGNTIDPVNGEAVDPSKCDGYDLQVWSKCLR